MHTKYKSLIFDFDGTLADTLEEGRKIYNELALEMKVKQIQPHELHELRQMNLDEFLSHVGISKRRVPRLLYRGTKMLKSRIASLSLIDGIRDVLHKLRAECDHFGILTSNSVENVEIFLASHGLEDLFTFVSSTSKLSGKAKHLRSIRRTFSIRPNEMIYIGDEIRDIKASKKAKVPIAAVGWGFNSADTLGAQQPDYLFNDPQELLQLV